MAIPKPMPIGVDRHALAGRLWAKVEKGPDCWPWTARRQSKGYGVITVRGKQYLAHRIVWWFVTRTDPEDLCVLHKCDNPACCRPNHLFLGTVADNSLDMMSKGRGAFSIAQKARIAQMRAVTHCKWGHAFTPDNTYVTPKGFRICRICARERLERFRSKNRHP